METERESSDCCIVKAERQEAGAEWEKLQQGALTRLALLRASTSALT